VGFSYNKALNALTKDFNFMCHKMLENNFFYSKLQSVARSAFLARTWRHLQSSLHGVEERGPLPLLRRNLIHTFGESHTSLCWVFNYLQITNNLVRSLIPLIGCPKLNIFIQKIVVELPENKLVIMDMGLGSSLYARAMCVRFLFFCR